MKKRSRILVLILTAMLSTEPVQIVYAETAEATHVTSESTSVNPKEENADNSAVVPPKADPGWVAVEKGYQWRQEDGTLLQKSGWVTINGRKYYLHKSGIRYSGWQIYKNKKRYYLSNGDAARNRWIKYKGNYYYIRKNGTSAPKSKWLTVKGKRYYIGRKGYRLTGLQTIKGKKYYFNSKGVLIRNKTSYKIKGKEYEINSEGVAIQVSALKAECM